MPLPNLKQTFRTANAFWIAFIGGLLLTGLNLLAHVRRDWTIDSNYHIVYSFTVNFLLLFVVLVYNFRVVTSNLPTKWKYVLGLVGSLAIAGLFSVLAGWMHSAIYDNLRLSDTASINLTRDFVVAVFAVLISISLYSITRRHQTNIEKQRLETENLTVRYEALEKQLDPHFLFNSLNTLSGLIGNDDAKAQKYLQQLASTYRYTMQGKRLVPLEDELAFTESYCQMMQIRYGDNLRIERNIQDSFLQHLIIPISIQLLVENALKHNVVSDRYPLTLHLETTPNGTFRVSNTIRRKQEEAASTGLGLANLAERYQLLCKKEIVISDADNTFSVELPLLIPNSIKDKTLL